MTQLCFYLLTLIKIYTSRPSTLRQQVLHSHFQVLTQDVDGDEAKQLLQKTLRHFTSKPPLCSRPSIASMPVSERYRDIEIAKVDRPDTHPKARF
jgi:hypothetical protein